MFTRLRCPAAVLFLSLVSVSSFAADAKRMPATDCHLEYDDNTVSGNDHWDRGFARFGARNPWTDIRPINIVCPLVRSNTTNTNGLTALKVNLLKGQATYLTCYAESVDVNGSLVKRVARTKSNTLPGPLDWAASLNSSSAKGTYGLMCEIVGAFDANEWGDELTNVEYTEP